MTKVISWAATAPLFELLVAEIGSTIILYTLIKDIAKRIKNHRKYKLDS